ncbi:hypothetical protein ACIBSV_49655 [Embleya sp. NPDC050154]|uniref:hypothetical protein n=1 Tax=Embleya sp. NPDC050154 TaxID=3363988 RepID=UPI0037879715
MTTTSTGPTAPAPKTLLTYSHETIPHPLNPSAPVGELEIARLRLLVSNPLPDPVRCSRITIVLPVGTVSASALAETGVGIVATATPHTWSVVAIQEDVLVAVPQDGTAEFTRSDHANPDQVTGSLAIQIDGIKVSREEGTATVRVIESASASPDAPEIDRDLEIDLDKIRLRWRRDLPTEPAHAAGTGARTDEDASSTANLTARLSPGDPAPATLVPRATPIVLTWQGPTGDHVVYSRTTPNGVTATFPFQLPGLDRDETFVVKTTKDGVDRYDSVTVTVDAPLLASLRTDELAAGTPDMTLTGPAVTCTRTLNAGALVKSQKSCTVHGAVTVTAPIATPSLTATGAVTGTGANPRITAGSLSVTGTLQSDDTLDATKGPVKILGEPVVHNTADLPHLPATTDGFLVVSASWARNVKVWDSKGVSASDSSMDSDGGTTAALPVHRADTYDGAITEPHGTSAQFVFYPIGRP